MSSISHVTSEASSQPPSLQEPLADLISRIELLIAEKRKEILPPCLKELTCSITYEILQDPVVTNCGHLFEKTQFARWRLINNTCPTCRKQITGAFDINELKESIPKLQLEEPIPTFSLFDKENTDLAAEYITFAGKLIDRKEYRRALQIYFEVFRCHISSDDYRLVPWLYEQLGETEKADLARLYLGLYQLKEGKVGPALASLAIMTTKELQPILEKLRQRHCYTPQELDELIQRALGAETSDEAISLYKLILSYDPDRLDVYRSLLYLVQPSKERNDLLLQAADRALALGQTELEAEFRNQIQALPMTTITVAGWTNPTTLNLPPYPQELVDFLAEDCPFWPGKKRSETHIVVPCFPRVQLEEGGEEVPLTLATLNALDKKAGGTGYRYIWDKAPQNVSAEDEFHWAVMTRNVIPGSGDRTYAEQQQLMPAGYEVPGVLDAAIAIFWEYRRSNERLFSDHPWTFSRCKEEVEGGQLIIGGFARDGLGINFYYNFGYGSIGVAGWWKF